MRCLLGLADIYDALIAFSDKPDSKAVSMKVKSNPTPSENPAPAERHMVNRLRDLLLDIEDRIYQGTLGALKVQRPFFLGPRRSKEVSLVQGMEGNSFHFFSCSAFPNITLKDSINL